MTRFKKSYNQETQTEIWLGEIHWNISDPANIAAI